MIPVLRDEPLYFEVFEEVGFPNRKGYNSTVKFRPGGLARKITPGDYDLYGRVMCWVLEGKAQFVERSPLRGRSKGKAKVEN